jgi:hypothetical protein
MLRGDRRDGWLPWWLPDARLGGSWIMPVGR